MTHLNATNPEPSGHDTRALWPRLLTVTAMIVLLAAARLFPHPPNFTPIGAMAIFGGACLATRRSAMLIPLLALIASDLVLGFHGLAPVVYGSFLVNVVLGRWLRTRRSIGRFAAVAIAGSVQFFLITNLACWVFWYPHTLEGLSTCFLTALPFFRNTLLSTTIYCGLLFGGLKLIESGFPVLRDARSMASA